MTLWEWVLIGLCCAGVVLAAASLVMVALAALRLKKRLDALLDQPILASIETAQQRVQRLSRFPAACASLADRAAAATASMSDSAQNLRFPVAVEAVARARQAFTALGADLR